MKVAIASGKGGTGKTLLATNLSELIAEEKALIITDLDVEEPNAALFLKGELSEKQIQYNYVPEWNEGSCILCGKCQEYCNFNAIVNLGNHIVVFPRLCHSCYACSELCPTNSLPMMKQKIGVLNAYKKDKLAFVDSQLDIGQEQAIPLIKQTKDFVNDNYRQDILKIYDCPPGTSCPVIESLQDADFVILVSEPTPFGLHDLRLAVNTVRSMKLDFALVVNRAGLGNADIYDYCEKEKIEIFAEIPNDIRIARDYAAGKLVYKNIPEFRSQLEKIRDHIYRIMDQTK